MGKQSMKVDKASLVRSQKHAKLLKVISSSDKLALEQSERPIQSNPDLGLFRVIYWKRLTAGLELFFCSDIVEAKNGFDAQEKINDLHKDSFSPRRMRVHDVICLKLPENLIRLAQQEFPSKKAGKISKKAQERLKNLTDELSEFDNENDLRYLNAVDNG